MNKETSREAIHSLVSFKGLSRQTIVSSLVVYIHLFKAELPKLSAFKGIEAWQFLCRRLV